MKKILNRYVPNTLIFLAFVSVILFCFFNKDFSYSLQDAEQQKLELVSWVFSGVMGVVSFLAIFISFVYDNNLIGASKNLRQLYHPYGLGLEEFRANYNEYIRNISRRTNVNILFITVLVTTLLSIIIWGISALLYNGFSMKLPQKVSDVKAIVNVLVYAIWILLSGLLASLCHLLNHIRTKKDPLGGGFLPDKDHLLDIDLLSAEDTDLAEIFRIISPSIELHENPQNSNGNEISIFFPMTFSNIRFVIKLFDEKSNLLFRLYGITEKKDAGKPNFFIVSNSVTEKVAKVFKEQCVRAEFRYYNETFNKIARINGKVVTESKLFSVVPDKINYLTEDGIDRDHTLINNIQSNKFFIQQDYEALLAGEDV
ncbi:hypothetical protein [Paenibacillus sp. EZ-K15]|uniref:hypothetical protein n=1 Tax=Paenibacillus sp. EZ-K15 TaxID=2044275 RepID=UPI000BF4B810|nr:hypothetical protein [Paenibacillus sp. EZ-K15]